MTQAVPVPRTWAAGDAFTAALANQELRDMFDWLMDPPSASVRSASGTSIASGGTFTGSPLSFDTESWDWATEAMHDTSTNPSRLYFPSDGRYLFIVQIDFALAATPTGDRALHVRANAAGNLASGTSILTRSFPVNTEANEVTSINWAVEMRRSAGDYLELWVRHTQGANNVVTAGLSASWLGT